jgi:hypothetical protein
MADPNQLSRQERRLVDQIHPAKLATEQRLIPRRTGHWARRPRCAGHAVGEVGPVRVGGPDRRQQVGGQGQMQHLLLGHLDDHDLPGGHPGQLLVAQPLISAALEGELGEQVLTHQPVLQLTGLVEQPHESTYQELHHQRLKAPCDKDRKQSGSPLFADAEEVTWYRPRLPSSHT